MKCQACHGTRLLYSGEDCTFCTHEELKPELPPTYFFGWMHVTEHDYFRVFFVKDDPEAGYFQCLASIQREGGYMRRCSVQHCGPNDKMNQA